jgi:type IV secretory pathway VirD2 relaxase
MSSSESARQDRTVPDRIGQMGGRRGHDSRLRAQIARRLGGQRPQGHSRSNGSANGTGNQQRVVVRSHVSRHSPATARTGLRRFASYLARDSASIDGKAGTFFDSKGERLDASQEMASWAPDRHHFRIILSPEQSGDMDSLREYARRVMQRMERDLKTPLTWLAIEHHNTENPHLHVVIRGITPDGSDLVIPQQYLAYGLRARASQIATSMLGPPDRSLQEKRRQLEVQALRPTWLDTLLKRAVERDSQGTYVDLGPGKRVGFRNEDRALVLGRLAFLERLELARHERGTRWSLAPDFEQKLHAAARREAMLERLTPLFGREAMQVSELRPEHVLDKPLAGIVITKGAMDEQSSKRFVVLESADGARHFARIPQNASYERVQPGSVVEVAFARVNNSYNPLTPRLQMRVLSAKTLGEQVEALARTWLDRQLWSNAPHAALAQHPKVRSAQEQRLQWLVAKGYTQAHPTDPSQVLLKPHALKTLSDLERQYLMQQVQKDLGGTVSFLSAGRAVTGRYAGTHETYQGRFAAISNGSHHTLVWVPRQPNQAIGSTITLQRAPVRQLAQDITRNRELSLSRQRDYGLEL